MNITTEERAEVIDRLIDAEQERFREMHPRSAARLAAKASGTSFTAALRTGCGVGPAVSPFMSTRPAARIS